MICPTIKEREVKKMNKKNVKLKNVGECFAFDKGDMLKGGES